MEAAEKHGKLDVPPTKGEASALKGSRRFWWLAGLVIVVFGFLAAAVILPMVSPTPGTGGPAVNVPKMENVPPPEAPNKLQLEVDKDKRE